MIFDLRRLVFIYSKEMFLRILFFCLLLNLPKLVFAQTIPAGYPILEELSRRSQLESESNSWSFLLRPVIQWKSIDTTSNNYLIKSKLSSIQVLPVLNTTRFSSERPYGWGDYGLIPNPGFQTYFSGGIHGKISVLNFTFRPEVSISENKGFSTGIEFMSIEEIRNRFEFWNWGDNPEIFGQGWYTKSWWGQSKLTLEYGAFETGISTQNIWWGPGQFNALTFSNNAQGFPHLTFNTTKPAKTFIGNFEGQIIVGRLENSGFAPSQNQALNDRFFKPFSGDWRYLNAITFSWNPKWIKGFFFGFSRTFQQYNANRGNKFLDFFPVFEPFQKRTFFEDGNSVDFDANGRDQTISIFGRLVIPKTKSELYFEYGRRDHAFSWREFILNPEHARAYILGFNRIFRIPNIGKALMVRSEITHQQESINRTIRYGIRGGLLTWHTHTPARGFVNYGQSLGVGIGTGSNVQTIELSMVDGISKKGFFFERLANNQDFYYSALFQFTERKPWIDYSLGLLYDKQFNNLLLSSKLQIIHARNYQWQLDPSSTPEFSSGKNITSFLLQTSLIYLINK